MKIRTCERVSARIIPTAGKYLRTYCEKQADGIFEIRVGRGERRDPLAFKEIFAKGIRTCREMEIDSCLLDLTTAGELGGVGISAAVEGAYCGAYRECFTMSGRTEPELELYACGENLSEKALSDACILAEAILRTRNLAIHPGNLLNAVTFPQELKRMAEELPVTTEIYDRKTLQERGLNAILAVGDSADNPPAMVVLRYDGDPDSDKRIGLIGKGVTVDTGGYCLKSAGSMGGTKRDMSGAAAAAGALCAIAACGLHANVTAVIPIAENRLSPGSLIPGDVITSYSGKTIEVLNTDAEGRLILADALTWAVRQEGCTHLVDIATLTGAVYTMFGHVATGSMSNDDAWYAQFEKAAVRSGEKFWRLPAFEEYEKLIESDFADVRNTSKSSCGTITAGLFLRMFTEDRPWIHLDIAATAYNDEPIWQHQPVGPTGTPVCTLFYLAELMAEDN